MKLLHRCSVFSLVLLFAISALAQKTTTNIPTPSQFVGFEVGADRQLADYKQVVAYLKKLAELSPKIQVESLGPSTLNNDIVMAVISSPENLKNKARYKEIAHKLADPRGLTQEQIDALAREGKAIALITCNIHSTEIASTQMVMEWAHELVTSNDPAIKDRLDKVILLIVPSINPDGQIMVVDWYKKYLGTKYEGGQMPYLYHWYVGHDDNRDWYMLTQKETQAVTRAAYIEWKPQIWLDEHQMGSNGPRLFVPPDADPIGMRQHPLIFSGKNMIGTNMAFRLEEAHKSGVIHSWVYDNYWPGATEGTAMFKNVFGLLTEAASVRIATPIEISSTELSGGGKGMIDYAKQANYPNPWPGGVWRLRDIMDYELIASNALLETVALYKDDYQRGVARMNLDAVASYKPNDYFRVPMDDTQRDPETAARMVHLILQHGGEAKVSADGKSYYIPLAQPYGNFFEELLTSQRYPEVRPTAGKDILAPYDVTAWSLPLLMDVKIERLLVPAEQVKALRPFTENDWPKGGVIGKGAVLALTPEATSATKLLNAALKAKANVSVAKSAFNYEGRGFPAGTLLFDNNADIASLGDKYHLALIALRSKPDAKLVALKPQRVGLYKPFQASMDEGWTRFVLDQYGFAPISIENKTMKAGKLNDQFDVIILADIEKDVIVDGQRKRGDNAMKYTMEMPEEYRGGIGKEGVQALKDFVQNGGSLITIGDSGELVATDFNVPVRNVLAGSRDDFNIPGSIVRILVDTEHPVGYGMANESAAYLDGPIAYQTMLPGPELKRYVISYYPDDARDILLSGYAKGQERLTRKSAVVAFEQGKGKIVMFGFRPQYRAQSEGTYKMLFNAIRWAEID